MLRPAQRLGGRVSWGGAQDGGNQGLPELAMQYAMMLPMNQAQTAVAGPPEDMGEPKVAGTEPSTPRMEMA